MAIATTAMPVVDPVHLFKWFSLEEISSAEQVAEDSRIQAMQLFALVDRLAPGAETSVPHAQ